MAEDIGRQIVTTGRRMNPAEIERVVDRITEKDVIEFAKKTIWDQDVAVSAFGQIEGVCCSYFLLQTAVDDESLTLVDANRYAIFCTLQLLDYQRIRGDTTRMFS